ncbi:symmetrical bis(5'-nucleosyl)-tetraphosphatase [Sinimarinibacterium thermocellulolyticum]|uniref:bis(5'-nucleosyl)-tetraphosphatase (symmetrical) n=1 Tax=Sinimarinibacterium thermocellulolyticum TaxID=3170016 RepID=A0ABV2A634_9GAMM
MSTYVIGDIQGCRDALLRLLERCRFDPAADRLICAGDLVARGPDSLGTLRFVHGLGTAATAVLGNHDLHLLALAQGFGRARDGLDTVVAADDAETLLEWLSTRPLALHHAATDTLIVHAGVAPQWTVAQTLALAGEAQAVFADRERRRAFLPRMYGDAPARWRDDLTGDDRLRCIVNVLTRARYCSAQGDFEFAEKGSPGAQAGDLMPWFEVPERRSAGTRIVFGHWSTLGRIHWPQANVWGLDTGCVWGGALSALRLEDLHLLEVPCAG